MDGTWPRAGLPGLRLLTAVTFNATLSHPREGRSLFNWRRLASLIGTVGSVRVGSPPWGLGARVSRTALRRGFPSWGRAVTGLLNKRETVTEWSPRGHGAGDANEY